MDVDTANKETITTADRSDQAPISSEMSLQSHAGSGNDNGDAKSQQEEAAPQTDQTTTTTTATTYDHNATTEPTANDNNEEKEEDRDEEGLLRKYDVVICGTGLVQSILASAFARASLQVLHVDGADQYGEYDAMWTPSDVSDLMKSIENDCNHDLKEESLPSSSLSEKLIPLSPSGGTTGLRFHSQKSNEWNGITVGCQVQIVDTGDLTKTGVVQSIEDGKVVVELQDENHDSNPIDQKNETNEDQTGEEDDTTNDPPPSVPPPPSTPSMLTINLPPVKSLARDDADEAKPDSNADVPLLNDDPIELEKYLSKHHKILSMETVNIRSILQQQQRWMALDATPFLILSSGPAVQGMLASGVAEYMEFKTMLGLYWLGGQGQGRPKSSSTPTGNNALLERVPCSKNDVFTTKLLKPMDKRRLMKFLQLALDYATKQSIAEELEAMKGQADGDRQESDGGDTLHDNGTHQGNDNSNSTEDVNTLNERHLNQGRSLARPQNKAVATDELEMLQKCMSVDVSPPMSFDSFLDRNYKLSESLRHLVRYALAWETTATNQAEEDGEGQSVGLSLEEGMSNIRRNVQALGRYGTTPFLFPMYGSGELSQSFCRSAAVFGATYLLRRAPVGIMVTNDNQNAEGIMLANDRDTNDTEKDDSKFISCKHVIVSANASNAARSPTKDKQASPIHAKDGSPTTKALRTLRRISVLKGKILPSPDDSHEQRQLLFIPPKALNGRNPNVVHGIILDESVCVAPIGCTVLHLSTTVTESTSTDLQDLNDPINMKIEQEWADLLEETQRSILASQLKITRDTVEVYHVCFSHPQQQDSASPTSASTSLPRNVHVCHHTGQALTADVAFEQAKEIFSEVCPGMQFLELSTAMDEKIRERVEERRFDDDDEKLMLDSALGMIADNNVSENTPKTENDKSDCSPDPAIGDED